MMFINYFQSIFSNILFIEYVKVTEYRTITHFLVHGKNVITSKKVYESLK